MLYLGLGFGTVIAALAIASIEDFILWSVTLPIISSALVVVIFFSQYFTKLETVQIELKEAQYKNFLSFLWMQFVSLLFIFIIISANLYAASIQGLSDEIICCLREKVEDKLDSHAAEIIDLLLDGASIDRGIRESLLELNLVILSVLATYIILNVLFFFKYKSNYKAIQDNAPESGTDE